MTEHSTGVTVVIPTFKRPRLLLRCLEALTKQTFPSSRVEVIVCDDARDEATESVTAQLLNRVPYRLRYLPVVETKGPAGARNKGWQEALFEVIAFTDDDTIPEARWLEEGMKAIRGTLAVSGRVVVPIPRNPSDYERNEAGLERTEFVTANCFVRKVALEALGGFDERFTAAWREDSDLHFRLLESCISPELERVVRCESARVIHPVRPAAWGISLQQQRKVLYDALLYKKHPERYRRHIEATPPTQYYASTFALVLAGVVGGLGMPLTAILSLGVWAAMIGSFCWRRLSGTSHKLSHIIEILVTSVCIPPVAIFWRLVGAHRFGVVFL
jgi:glycosyltransferase involved in cell wall biosynthesis